MKKTKRCILKFPVTQETLARFQIGFEQNPDKSSMMYTVVYVSDKSNIEDKALIEKTKRMVMEVLSNPKAIVRTEEVEESRTDSSYNSVVSISEKVFEVEG